MRRNNKTQTHDKPVELHEQHKYRRIPFRPSIMSRMFWIVEKVNELRDTFGRFYASTPTRLILCWWWTLALEPLIQTISGDRLMLKALKLRVFAYALGDTLDIRDSYYDRMWISRISFVAHGFLRIFRPVARTSRVQVTSSAMQIRRCFPLSIKADLSKRSIKETSVRCLLFHNIRLQQ